MQSLTRTATAAAILVMLGILLAACSNDDESSTSVQPMTLPGTKAIREFRPVEKEAQQTLSKQIAARGNPVRSTRCIPLNEPTTPGLTAECLTEYEYGPNTRCQVGSIHNGEYTVMSCIKEGPDGEWFNECLKETVAAACRDIGEKQVDYCADSPRDLKMCRSIIYGTRR